MKIAQILRSNSWGDVTPDAINRGIGGREGALIYLSREWAKLGHEVTNFVSVNKASRIKEKGFHEYIPLSMAQPSLASWPYDAVVAWECPSVYENDHVKEKQNVRLTHMQVAHLSTLEQEAANNHSTGVVALSEWARDLLVHDGLENKNLYVRPNGVNLSAYPYDKIFKKPKKKTFVYSSSPDRGLVHLLKMWPRIKKRYPDALLYVAYGVEQYVAQMMWAHSKIGEVSIDIIEGMQQKGVVDLGKIGQDQLAKIQMNATAWIYPADTIQATETGCITAIENMAAGNVCLMSDADCLKDEFGKPFEGLNGGEIDAPAFIEPLPFEEEKWVSVLVGLLETEKRRRTLPIYGRAFAEKRDWSVIAPTWIELFEECNA